jgi:PadR family transcriptional regulator, regulatory protein PadR
MNLSGVPGMCLNPFVYQLIGSDIMTTYDQKEERKKDVRGNLDKIIIGFVTKGEMHGYEIMQRVNKKFDVNLGPSTIYPALNSMEKKGVLTAEWKFDTDTKKPRKVYRPTNKAAKNLEDYELFLSEIKNILPSRIEMGMIESPAAIEAGMARKTKA